jgi:DNA-binding NtrC family response regulator
MDTSGRVLVATSNDEFRALLSQVLGSWRLQSTSCSTLAEARQAISDSQVLLVFCDRNLPEGDFSALLNVASRHAPPKIVVLLPEDGEYAQAIGMGAFDALPIPCQRQDVQWMLIQAMRDDNNKRRRPRFDLGKPLEETGYQETGLHALSSGGIRSEPDLTSGSPSLDDSSSIPEPKAKSYLL